MKALVVGGLAALMALWGLGSVLGSRSAGDAGTLFGRKISWRAFSEQQQLIAQSAPLLLGERGLSPEALPTHTWMRLMLLEEAHRRLLSVTDEDVIATIEHLPPFAPAGHFDQDRYQRVLQWYHLPPRRFEEEIRQRLLIDRLRAQVVADVPLDEPAGRQAYDREHEQFQVRYALVETKRVAADAARAQTVAHELRQALQRAGSRSRALQQAARQHQGRLVEPPPLTAHTPLEEGKLDAARVIDAARALAPQQWSEPLAVPDGWIVVQLLRRIPPEEAAWRKDREAFLSQWRAAAQQQRWQVYLTDVLQRAQLTSYLR